MPINPNVPGDNDYIASFPAQNRANMQAAASQLQALTDTTQDLEGKIDPLHSHESALLALAGQSGAILDSVVVEDNLDVLNPPTGRYVRYENGLQICFGIPSVSDIIWIWDRTPREHTIQGINFQNGYIDIPFPAAFSEAPEYAHLVVKDPFSGDVGTNYGVWTISYDRSSSNGVEGVFDINLIMGDMPGDFYHEAYGVTFIAIGRWK